MKIGKAAVGYDKISAELLKNVSIAQKLYSEVGITQTA